MLLRNLFEAQYHDDIAIQINNDLRSIIELQRTFDLHANIRGWEETRQFCLGRIKKIHSLDWYYQLNLTTPKLKLAYQNLQNEIQKLTDKINGGV